MMFLMVHTYFEIFIIRYLLSSLLKIRRLCHTLGQVVSTEHTLSLNTAAGQKWTLFGVWNMEVSWNKGIFHFIEYFKPSIIWYPHFRNPDGRATLGDTRCFALCQAKSADRAKAAIRLPVKSWCCRADDWFLHRKAMQAMHCGYALQIFTTSYNVMK